MQENGGKTSIPLLPLRRQLGVWVILALVVVATVVVKLWRMKYNKYRYQDVYYGVKVLDAGSENEAKLSRAVSVAKANQIRSQWQPWAEQHRDLLTRMLQAKQSDYRPLGEVYALLPVKPRQVGVTLTGSSSPTPAEADRAFTWNPAAKLGMPRSADHVEQATRRAMAKSINSHLQRGYVRFRDIELSQSMDFGLSHVSVWASGRITETSEVRQNIVGQPPTTEGEPHQISPPFEFLIPTGKGQSSVQEQKN